MSSDLPFYLIAALTVGFAIAAMSLRRLVHCALCAAAAFAGLAMAYLQLDAEFVGFAQLLVYVGAIAILIVFAVLLTRGDEVRPDHHQTSPTPMAGIAVAALVLAGIAIPIFTSPSLRRVAPPTAIVPVKKIGEVLMTRYVLPLEMVGVVLTGALLGAVVVAMSEDAEVKLTVRRKPAGHAELKGEMSLP